MQTPMAVRTQFSLGDATLFAGYTLGERWNGFACPYFTAQQANTWMAHYNAQYHAEYGIDTVRYDADHDAYVITYPDDPERPADIYAGKDLETVDGRRHVYPIGAGDWIWSEPVVN